MSAYLCIFFEPQYLIPLDKKHQVLFLKKVSDTFEDIRYWESPYIFEHQKNNIMVKKFIFLFAIVGTIWSCGNEPATDNSSAETAPMTFGDEITSQGSISLDLLTAQLAQVDTVYTKVTGEVASVCKKKGCWMNLADDSGKEIFVKFKDYGFFMPLDCEGQKLVMSGFATKELTSVEELRHYAEDEGKSAEEIAAITEPKEEYTFLANGVVFVD